MNGAAAVPPSSINVPKTTSTNRIGSIHHFLFSSRYSPISPNAEPRARPCCARELVPDMFDIATFSLELLEIAGDVRSGLPLFPVRRCASVRHPIELVPADQPEDAADHGEETEVGNAQEHMADDP